MGKGFSLIELIVVIAIMGVLTFIALPNYTAIQKKSKLAALATSGQTIQTAIESYAITNGSYPTGTGIDGGELLSELIESGDLKSIPKNPYTGEAFSSSDSAGKILYTYDSSTQVYQINLYGDDVTAAAITLTN